MGEELEQKGEDLMLLAIENGFAIMNDSDSSPTFYSNRGISWVVVTLGKGWDEWKWDTTSQMIINKLKEIFARYEIAGIVVTDRGPQFGSDLFAVFAKKLELQSHHVFATLPTQQWNGRAS